MIKSISYWCFKGGLDDTLPVRNFIDQASAAGFPAVELCMGAAGDLTMKTTETQARAIAAYARQKGVALVSLATGLLWSCSLTDPRASVRKKADAILRRQIELAAWLGIHHILVIPGAVDVFFIEGYKPVPYEFVDRMSRAAIRRAIPRARRCNVRICVENVWNKFLLSPLEMRDYIDSFHSPFVKSYLDIGNMLLTGYPDQWIRILGKRIGRVHVKDFKKSVGTVAGFGELFEGDVDFKACKRALRDVGYQGSLTAEILPFAEGRVERTSKAMDRIMAM